METIEYNEIEYWNKRRHPNSEINARLSEEEFYIINKYAYGNILEYGCGIGRCFPAYTKTASVTGIDISAIYRERAVKEADKYELNFTHQVIDSSVDFIFDNNTFDTAFAIKVLQHVKPEYVKEVLDKLTNVASIVVMYNGVFGDDLAPHCFSHDYETIIENLGLNIIEKKQKIYVVNKSSVRNS